MKTTLFVNTFVPPWVSADECADDYTPWVVAHEDSQAVTHARLQELWDEWNKINSDETVVNDTEQFYDWLREAQNYTIFYMHEIGICQLR